MKNIPVFKKIADKTLPLLLVASLYSCSYFNGNIHAVKEGRVYRSAQLNDKKLEDVIKEFGIKTVVNLRGEYAGEGWYEDEISVCEKYGVKHYSVRFSAKSLPKKNLCLSFSKYLTAQNTP